jgi:uncharacterized protein (DUF58 family)
LLLSLAVGLAAVNTGNNLLYLLFAMMLSLILVSGVLSERSLSCLSATRTLPPRLFAGSAAPCHLTLTNGKRFMAGFSLRVRERAVTTQIAAEEAYCPRLDPGGHLEIDTTLTFRERGLHRLDGIDVTTTFPFGFFEKTFRLPAETYSLVYPAIDPTPAGAALAETAIGARTGARGATGLQHLRDYHDGDDPRYIHWKHSARRAKLVVREPEREMARTVVLVFSNRLPPDPLPVHRAWFEDAVRLTASLASQAIHDGSDVLVATWDGVTRAGRGRAQLERVLRTLATVAPSPPSRGDRLAAWAAGLANAAPFLILVWDDPAWSRVRPRCGRVWVMSQRGQTEDGDA